MGRFSAYEYRKLPGFDMNTFEGANQAIPMKTLVIHCFDPRAAEIPQAVGWTRRCSIATAGLSRGNLTS
jgi:carbonic anhydrase